MEEKREEGLYRVVSQVAPDRAARERMLEGIKKGRRSRKRLSARVPAAALAVCLLLSILWFGMPGLTGEELVVYAATEDNGWQKLKEGEKILLEMEPYMVKDEDEDFDEIGYPRYYPYRCTFRLELPDNCLYGRDFVTLGDDMILERGGRIEWCVAPERPENEGKVRQGSLTLWLVNDNIVKDRRERIRGYKLELTKEDGKCYAELKRVWDKQRK